MSLNQIFDYLHEANPELAKKIAEAMWDIDEIVERYDFKSLQMIVFSFIQDFDEDALAACLHGIAPEKKDKVLDCLSKRGKARVEEALEFEPLLPVKEVKSQQTRFCNIARDLNKKGAIHSILDEVI